MKTVTGSTKNDTEKEIMLWLRNARDRYGGRKRREQQLHHDAEEN